MGDELLEQALIDAKKLRETAIKAAEKDILDKNASKIKEQVDKMLFEQDELEDLDLDPELMGMDDEDTPPELDPVAAEIPVAAQDGENLCACPEEDEEIEIDFASLAQKLNDTEDGLSGNELEPQDMEQLAENTKELIENLEMFSIEPTDKVGVVITALKENKELTKEQKEEVKSFLSKMKEKIVLEEGKEKVDETISLLDDYEDNLLLEEIEANDLEDIQSEEKPQENYKNVEDALNELEDEEVELPENFLELLDVEEKGKSKTKTKIDKEIEMTGDTAGPTEREKEHLEDIALALDLHDSRLDEAKKIKIDYQKMNELFTNVLEENKSLKLQNNELKSIAIEASKKLPRLAFQNAILHYKNRTLMASSLNERQKKNIVDALSKVGSVEEAKLVFESLMSSPEKAPASKEKPKTLQEITNTKNNVLSYNRSNNEKPAKPSHPEKSRWQELAGIKK